MSDEQVLRAIADLEVQLDAALNRHENWSGVLAFARKVAEFNLKALCARHGMNVSRKIRTNAELIRTLGKKVPELTEVLATLFEPIMYAGNDAVHSDKVAEDIAPLLRKLEGILVYVWGEVDQFEGGEGSKERVI